MVINAEEFVKLSLDEVWANYNSSVKEYQIAFPRDDSFNKVLTLPGTNLIITWYGLRFVRGLNDLSPLYPHAAAIQQPPVRASYCYVDDFFNPNLQLNWMNRIFWQVWEDIDGALYPEELSWLVDQIDNDLYNMHVEHTSKYISTMNIIDNIEIINDPRARKAIAEATPTPESISEVYDVHIDILDDKEGVLTHNNLVNNWRAGLPKRQQTLQMIGIRGFLTEGDSAIIPKPIMGSFVRGLGNLDDVAIESCSSKKAQIMTTDPVALTEYFSRRLQLLTAYIHTLSRSDGRTTKLTDCGNNRTMAFTVGRYMQSNLAGVYRVFDDGTEVMLTGNEDDIAGTTINVRSPVYCGHRHEGRVCGKCMGGIAWSIDPKASLGHQSIIELLEPVIQSVISTKHEDQSATGEDIVIPDKYRDILKRTVDNKGIRFTDKMKDGYVLEISYKAIPVPSDIYIPGAVDRINSLNFSEVNAIHVIDTKKGTRTRVPVSVRKTSAYFSKHFLRYMATQPYDVNAAGNLLVRLDGFDMSKAVLRYPLKHRNTLDFMNDLASMIESKGDTKNRGQSYYTKKMTDFQSPDEAMQELASLVYSKFKLNFSHLGVLLLAILCRGKGDANIPRIDERSVFLSRDDIIDGRSVTSRLAFQGQGNLRKLPSAYTVKERMHVPMDIIMRQN